MESALSSRSAASLVPALLLKQRAPPFSVLGVKWNNPEMVYLSLRAAATGPDLMNSASCSGTNEKAPCFFCVWGFFFHITGKPPNPFYVPRGMESCSPLHYIQIGFKWDFAPSHLGVRASRSTHLRWSQPPPAHPVNTP